MVTFDRRTLALITRRGASEQATPPQRSAHVPQRDVDKEGARGRPSAVGCGARDRCEGAAQLGAGRRSGRLRPKELQSAVDDRYKIDSK